MSDAPEPGSNINDWAVCVFLSILSICITACFIVWQLAGAKK